MFIYIQEILVFVCKIVFRCCKYYYIGNILDGGVFFLMNFFIKLNYGKKKNNNKV